MSATSTPATTGKSSSLARNSAISLAVRLLAAISGLLVTTLITRTLEPAAAGSYFILFSFCSIGAIVIGCGVNLSVVRLVSESMALGRPAQARGAVRMVLQLLASASLLFAAALLLPPVRELMAVLLKFSPDGLLLVLLVAWTVGLALQSVLAESFRGLQDIFRASVYGGLCTSALCLTALGLAALYSVPTLRGDPARGADLLARAAARPASPACVRDARLATPAHAVLAVVGHQSAARRPDPG